MKCWWSEVNTTLIFWYFGGKLHTIPLSWITFWMRCESFTRKVKRRGTNSYYNSSVASLKDKLRSWCHKLEYIVCSRKFCICQMQYDCYRVWFCCNSLLLWWVDGTARISFDWEKSCLPWSPSHWTGTKAQNLAAGQHEKHLKILTHLREMKTLFIPAPILNLWPSLQNP